MMHKAWSRLGEVPYCFTRSSVKFEGRAANKMSILTQIGRFQTVYLQFKFTDGYGMMHKAWSSI